MAEQTQTTQQQTKKTYSYDPSSVYAWAQAGSNQTDLSKYGIDFSQEDQDRIANIFKDNATASYNQAQNQYSQDIANQQATLSDTIRRSQAEAVATGASRGLQAANELSSMLGLQQAAAQGATQIQSDYATQLAAAQQQAAELQNQRNQVGAEVASADLAADAQKYTANMEYAANDFNRILSEAADLRAAGRTTEADMLINSYMSANGADKDAINSYINDLQNSNPNAIQPTEWTPGNDGTIKGASFSDSGTYQGIDWSDVKKGKSESFKCNIAGEDCYLEVTGDPITSSNNASLYNNLNRLAGTKAADQGTVVYYQGTIYLGAGGSWRTITGNGSGAYKGSTENDKGYNRLLKKLSGN